MRVVLLVGILAAVAAIAAGHMRVPREQPETAGACPDTGVYDDDQRKRPRDIRERCGSN